MVDKGPGAKGPQTASHVAAWGRRVRGKAQRTQKQKDIWEIYRE